MALDVDKLREGLNDYRSELERQREQLSAQHAHIQRCFDALFTIYGGRMSEELQHNWSRTSQWFEAYVERTHRLDRFMVERAENLKEL